MFFTGCFFYLVDGGTLDAEKECQCKDFILVPLLLLGVLVTMPLDLVTLPIQAIVYFSCKK